MDSTDRVEIQISTSGAAPARAQIDAIGQAVDRLQDGAYTAGDALRELGRAENYSKPINEVADASEKAGGGLKILSSILGAFNPTLAYFLSLIGRSRALILGMGGAMALVTKTLGALIGLLASPVFLTIVGTILLIRAAWNGVAEANETAKKKLEEYAATQKRVSDEIDSREKAMRGQGISEEIALATDPRVQQLMSQSVAQGRNLTGRQVVQGVQSQASEVMRQTGMSRDKAIGAVLSQRLGGMDAVDPVIAFMMQQPEWEHLRKAAGGNQAGEIAVAQALRPVYADRMQAVMGMVTGTLAGESARSGAASSDASMRRAAAEALAPGRMAEIEAELAERESIINEGKAAMEGLSEGPISRNMDLIMSPAKRDAIQRMHVAEFEKRSLLGEQEILRRRASAGVPGSGVMGPPMIVIGDNSNVMFRPIDYYGANATTQPAVP